MQFQKDFGTPAKGHDFGFIDQPIVVIDDTETRTIDTNANLWYYTHQLNIPGYPDADGYFHGTQTVDADGNLIKLVHTSDIPGYGTPNEDRNWLQNNAGSPVGDVTAEEAEYVMNWFKTHQITGEPTSIHWSEFFVMYVGYDGAQAIKAGGMDQLGYEDMEGNWEHVNNFNNATNTVMYVSNAGTEAWSYRATHSDTYQRDKYTIQYLRFTLPNGHEYEGWYVGMDYESIKYEGDGSLEHSSVLADGYYCDWVVKVCPGTHLGYPLTVRVMCEDLGHTYDWDFNDVVFDVSFSEETVYWPEYKKNVYATVVVEAAGGTMPIYIGAIDERYEIHRLLGDGSMTPIIHPQAFAVIKLNLTDLGIPYGEGGNNLANAKHLPVYVKGREATYTINASDTPQKFACPDYVDWAEECQNICDKYPTVPAWLTSRDGLYDAYDVWGLNPKN